MATSAPRRRWRRWLGATMIVLAVGLFVLWTTFWASPLATPAPYVGGLPLASPPPGTTIAVIETGITHRSAAFAYRGGSFDDARDFVMTAALVRHPKGDVLIDTGFGRRVDAHLATMPALFRAITTYERRASVAERFDAIGYDRSRLLGIVLTHAHWDHVSGVEDLADVPILVPEAEKAFVDSGATLAALAKSVGGDRYRAYAFEGGPYLGFPASHDVHGDGSIVIVPAPGHTPGSVIVFVTVAGGDRSAFVGDLVWQREGILNREERPWLQRTIADDDPEKVREGILRMAGILAAFPQMRIVPAHDGRAFEGLPSL